jgi:hypothetical protein
MIHRRLTGLGFACVLLVAQTAHAKPRKRAPELPASPPPDYHATLTLDMLALRFLPGSGPGAALGSELRLAPKWSLALGVGFGKRERVTAAGTPQEMTWGWDARVEPRFYALGRFAAEGLHVGWLTTFARAIDGPVQSDVFVPSPGLAMGPTLGVKSTSIPIIDVDVDAGPLFSLWQGPAADRTSRVGFFLSFGVGRSF